MSEIHRKADTASFSYSEIGTPFAQKGQFFDLPIGALRQKAFQYRSLTFVFLGLSVLLAIYFLDLAQQPVSRVFAAQTTKSGFVSKVVILNEDYTVPPKLVKDFIKRYIHVWFSGQVNEQTIQQNAHFMKTFSSERVTKRFQQFMKTHALKDWNAPVTLTKFKILDGNVVEVAFKMPKADEKGTLIGYNTFSGKFKLDLVEDKTQVQVYKNPFGFYIAEAKLALEGKKHE